MNASKLKEIQKIAKAKRNSKEDKNNAKKQVKSSKWSIIHWLDYHYLKFAMFLKAKYTTNIELWTYRKLSYWVSAKLSKDGFDVKYYEPTRYWHHGVTCIMW